MTCTSFASFGSLSCCRTTVSPIINYISPNNVLILIVHLIFKITHFSPRKSSPNHCRISHSSLCCVFLSELSYLLTPTPLNIFLLYSQIFWDAHFYVKPLQNLFFYIFWYYDVFQFYFFILRSFLTYYYAYCVCTQ